VTELLHAYPTNALRISATRLAGIDSHNQSFRTRARRCGLLNPQGKIDSSRFKL